MSAPLAGLLTTALPDPALRVVAEALGAPRLELEAPSAARPFAVGALAQRAPVLVVTATGREADDLGASVAEMLGAHTVAVFPSWETLPHERLSPRADTVGRRLQVLRRLAHPDEGPAGGLKVVVTTVRSLVQPMAPGLSDLEPVRLRVGEDHDFDALVTRLVELAYARVDMVGKRGEFAVRGGILDVFPPTADHPVRVEFWGDEVTELRAFSVADQRSIDDVDVELLDAPGCRELLLTEDVRERARQLASTHAEDAALVEMLDKLADGIPVEGMEALIPALLPGKLELLTDVLPAGAHVLLCDPEKIRTRAQDLVRTGQEFLEASWTAASVGGAAPLDPKGMNLGASAYRALREVTESAEQQGVPWWSLSPLLSGRDEAGVLSLDVTQIPPARGSEPEIAATFASLRAHCSSGGAAAVVVAGPGTAQRVLERLVEAEVSAVRGDPGAVPQPGHVTVLCGVLADGLVLPGAKLVVITESDLTGNRAAASTDGRRLPAKRRNQVDPLALTAGDMVVHDQHGIGKFVEMLERTVGGARRE
ncbi:MAG: CarD family transcriptional regulator, partial [Mycobacteriaceae bacterium]